jgi:hypothetical protein
MKEVMFGMLHSFALPALTLLHLFPKPEALVILRSRALARRLEGRPLLLVAHPSRLAVNGEHLRMTARRALAAWHVAGLRRSVLELRHGL